MFLHFIEKREHKEAFLKLAYRVADSDGFVNRNEWDYLRSWKLELGMESWEPDAEEEACSLAEMIGDIKEEQIRNLICAEILLLIYADGDYSEDERKIVCELQRLFGYSEATFGVFVDWVKRMGELRIEGIKLILDPAQAGR